jgi:ABC-type multidrug transport system ATPase subunit
MTSITISTHETTLYRQGDTVKVQMSTGVPAKMIDPPFKERFIQRTLLDHVSDQIHPNQLVALMGPSGS